MRIQSLKNIYHWLTAGWYALIYGLSSRKLTVIGVTGTDGKTTSCHLIYEMLKAAGMRVALVSTVGAFVEGEEEDTGLHVTTPDARLLQPFLSRLVRRGITHLVLEATSHGLDQNRLVGINFSVGIVTNVTHEHLDYHRSFDRYRQAKAKLIRGTKYALVNRDDPNFNFFKSQAGGKVIPFTKASRRVTNSALAGEYNRYNIGAAEAVAKVFRIPRDVVTRVVEDFAGVPGRREEVNLGQKFRAMVDFAHTPNALEQLLTQLRHELPKGKKLILVFGCAGLRDKLKRPMMGQIAKRLAEVAIITAEDPRTESLDQIYQQITAGKTGFIRQDDRQEAINAAVKMAKPGDIVVVTGKGHEKSMCFGATEYPWSDREAVEKAIQKYAN